MPLPAIVQVFYGSGGTSSSTGVSATSGSNITAGNVLVAMQYTGETANVASTPAGCVTWTQAGTTTAWANGAATGALSVGPVTSSGACTATYGPTGGSSTSVILAIWEISGITTTVDGTPGFSYFNAAGTVTGPSTTTTFNGDMVLAGAIWNTSTVTIGSPFTSSANGSLFTPAGVTHGDLSYDVQGTAGAINGSYTVASTAGDLAIVALKASGGGSGPTVDQLMAPNDVGSNLLVIPHSVVIGY
jgi:hypothetical protein